MARGELMSNVVELLGKWATLISAVYSEHTLAAAVCTLAGVAGCLYWFRTRPVPEKKSVWVVRVFVILVGWAILTPILGALFSLVGWLWNRLINVLDVAKWVLDGYSRQPLTVLVLLLLSGAAIGAWQFWRPTPALKWKACLGVLGFIAAIAIALPLAEVFGVPGVERPRAGSPKDTK